MVNICKKIQFRPDTTEIDCDNQVLNDTGTGFLDNPSTGTAKKGSISHCDSEKVKSNIYS